MKVTAMEYNLWSYQYYLHSKVFKILVLLDILGRATHRENTMFLSFSKVKQHFR